MIGIYKIVNLVNNKVYIGQSINLDGRFYDHKNYLNSGNHQNIYLQRAWDKYGESNFVFEIIELCEENKLTEREQYWIDFYGGVDSTNTYNLRDAGSGGRLSEITKQKISEKQKNIPKYSLRGRKASDEVRKKLSEAHKGHYVSEETRKKHSDAWKGKKNPSYGGLSENQKNKISKKLKAYYENNTEARKLKSEQIKAQLTPEIRYKLGSANRGKSYKHNLDLIQKHSASLKKAYEENRHPHGVYITANNITKTMIGWSEYLGVSYGCMNYHRKKGDLQEYIEKKIKQREK